MERGSGRRGADRTLVKGNGWPVGKMRQQGAPVGRTWCTGGMPASSAGVRESGNLATAAG